MKALLKFLVENKKLSFEQAFQAMEFMASAKASNEEMAFLLGALSIKGESPEEIAGFARALLQMVEVFPIPGDDLLDPCGTGGDSLGTFNISTASSLLLAACGVKIAKHGNRSVSSQSGSVDVLEKLGIAYNLSPEKTAECIKKNHFGFLFAPNFHPAFKNLVPLRKKLGIRTVFNLLGPLVNPAKARFQVMGIFSPQHLEVVAATLGKLGSKEAMVLHSEDGMDEISLCAPTNIAHWKNELVTTTRVCPEDFGLKYCPLEDLQGGDAQQNAKIIEDILSGKETGPKRDIVLANAAVSLLVYGKEKNLKDATALAKQTIECGKAAGTLKALRSFT